MEHSTRVAKLFDKMAALAGFSHDDCREFVDNAASLSPAEIGGILGYLLGRLDCHDAAAMVSAMREVHPQRTWSCVEPTVNLVGTGGGPSTFNITTTTAFLVAAAGVTVVKTGSAACRSLTGFVDVAAKLGTLKLLMPWEQIESIVDDVGIVFVPQLHYAPVLGILVERLTPPAYRNAGAYLNKIGPLLSPVKVSHQFIGASSAKCLEMLAGACCLLGDRPATLISAEDGMDEVSTNSRTSIVHLDEAGDRNDAIIDPEHFDISPPCKDELGGHQPTAAAECCERILGGEGTPAQNDIVALNAAVVLTYLDRFSDVSSAFLAAKELLREGEGLRKLQKLRARVWQCVKR